MSDEIRDRGSGLFTRTDPQDHLDQLLTMRAGTDVPRGWSVYRATWGAWMGVREPGNLFDLEYAEAGCTVGVISHESRAEAVAQIAEQERLIAAYRARGASCR